MRSEAEIRKQVENHLKRRGLLVLDGGLWLLAVFIEAEFLRFRGLSTTMTGLLTLLMIAWTLGLGLHFVRTVYVELREILVRRAIERERGLYLAKDGYEKPKRLDVSNDGELVDWSIEDAEAIAKHER